MTENRREMRKERGRLEKLMQRGCRGADPEGGDRENGQNGKE